VRTHVAGQHQTFSSEGISAFSNPLDRWALRQIRSAVGAAPIRLLLWDGFQSAPGDDSSVGSIVFRNRKALFSCVRDPELNFGETYMFGAVEVRGDLVAVLEALYLALHGSKPRPWSRLWQQSNGVGQAKEHVHHHYDLGNDFYRLWLDREMVYTCAYFPTPDASLEDAQIAKMERICRKLRLQPGERVAEAGCGWGSLALHMAKQHGVTVTAFNLSSEQIDYARHRAQQEGVADRVEFVNDDYRNLRGTYDVFVSVGMLEHVGLADFHTFGRVIDRTLHSDGRGLLHFIGRDRPTPLNPWIRKRIFPGAYPPTLREVAEGVLEPQNLSVVDVENLRAHYAKTLEHWRQRFTAAAPDVTRMSNATFARAWDLYLAGSQAAFTTGWMQLFQIVFVRGESRRVTWARV